MSAFSHPIAVSAPFMRSVAVAALLGATILASPLTAARADSATHATLQLAQAAAPPSKAATGATAMKPETVEQRITSLHTALKITADEESKWTGVAQAMRDNATAMQKLIDERAAQAPQSMTALDDLISYQKFVQAHVDGLKNLTAAFETLYNSMPDAQKKVADKVFQNSGHEGARAHS
jgi:chromosome segregation ATPase